MTEKQYGGATGRGTDKAIKANQNKPFKNIKKTEASTAKSSSDSTSSKSDYSNFIKAGKIASQAVEFAKTIVKKDVLLVDIANKIEDKIAELGGKPAFPVNLSINEVAAHYTPSFNDTTTASGLIKIDIGVQIDGYIADTAFSVDLDNNEENKKLIEAAESALQKAVETIKAGITIREVGKEIEKTIKSFGFSPIINLSGHSMEQYNLHSGITIPNTDNSREILIEEGVYAIEPFATTGLGTVRDGKPSGIYRIERELQVRDDFAREVLMFIYEEYRTLPFCSRWIHKRFGTRGLLALKRIEDAGILHHYPQLIEISGKPVSQAEHTIIIQKDKKTITTN